MRRGARDAAALAGDRLVDDLALCVVHLIGREIKNAHAPAVPPWIVSLTTDLAATLASRSANGHQLFHVME